MAVAMVIKRRCVPVDETLEVDYVSAVTGQVGCARRGNI
jgi:hypothetical protein